ncbi:MAG: hypothetical protein BWK79_16425 [Beggiatoa sp. IS2]|nr:MAG: hypothetical protein BWK79_16425 [Beggiatoa sp. IS2]
MPTVSYILETISDRYWERGGLEEQYPPQPKIHKCPYCRYKSTNQLSTHIGEAHPIERPIIRINNKTATFEQTIRSPITAQNIDLINVQKIVVCKNGGKSQEWTQDELKANLSDRENAHYLITLVNTDSLNKRPVEANYTFNIKIPDQTEIKAVNENFIHTLAIDNVKLSDVGRFSDICSKYQSATEYASALADYVMGVMIKDQNPSSGITLPLKEYPKKMQKAFATLHDFNYLIPIAICASIKFNLNDFRLLLPCDVELLDDINKFFSTVAVAREEPILYYNEPSEEFKKLPICPIDRDSFDILMWFQKICRGEVARDILTELSGVVTARKLSNEDRAKVSVLTVFVADSLKDNDIREQILKSLSNDPMFGKWAELQLNNRK